MKKPIPLVLIVLVLGLTGNATANEGWDDLIDDVRIYGYVLSDTPTEAQPDFPKDGDVIPGSQLGDDIYTTLDFFPGATTVKWTGYFSKDYAKVSGRAQDANLGPPPYPTSNPYRYYAGLYAVPPAVDSLVRGTIYYWTVDGEDAVGNVFGGDVWEFAIQDYSAFIPDPPNEATFVPSVVLLSWKPGYGVVEHDIYMGTEYEAVRDARYDFNEPGGPAYVGPDEYLITRSEPNYQCSGLQLETKYYWRVDEVNGRLPPPMGGGTYYIGDIWEFTTAPPGLGTINYELWENISGSLDALLNDPCYPDYPTSSGQLGEFDTEPVIPDVNYYGGQIEGWLYPPLTGDYTFWLATDEDGELWLSTDERPCSAELIAYIPSGSYANPYEWEKYSSQKTEPISLDNTRKYYIMARWKENLGDDHCMVAWQGPSMIEKEVIPGDNLSPFEHHLWAWGPVPQNGANVGEEETISLNWLPGDGVVSHDVYFGTDQAAVTDANQSSPEFQINLPLGTDSYMVADLVPFTTYYWRIDEVNESTVRKGCIWFFITGIDCNGNGIPDDIDIATGTSQDIDGNGVPDECDPDCNGNGIPDSYDISQGTSSDLDSDGIPDECQSDIIIVPVAVLDNPSETNEVRTILPKSITNIPQQGGTYYLEIWASDIGDTKTGLTGVYVDLSFCTEVSATDIQHGSIFTTFTSGTPHPGGVDEFGGSALPSGGGIEPEWVRIGWIEMTVNADVLSCIMSLLPSSSGVAALGRGTIPWEDIHLGSLSLLRDCNGNSIPDADDISLGTSLDCNGNDIPDECDIADGTSQDCNGNGIPDECDITSGTSLDCNGNDIPDECDIASGTSQDCNGNGIPDECDISSGTSIDGNGDGIPDECQMDVQIVPVVIGIEPNSTSEVRTVLPESLSAVAHGTRYYIEVWASDAGVENSGLTDVYVDLSFCGQTSATAVEHGTIFTTSVSGTIQTSGVDEFGGSARPSGGGIEPEWVRIGWIEMVADIEASSCTITLLPSSSGVAALGRGSIHWALMIAGVKAD
jgi:hypothetical protein